VASGEGSTVVGHKVNLNAQHHFPHAMRSSGTLSAPAIFFKAAIVPFLGLVQAWRLKALMSEVLSMRA
jgi:hypothetical protein